MVKRLLPFLLGLCLPLLVVAPALAAAPETPDYARTVQIGQTRAELVGFLNPGEPGVAGTYEFLYRASATECEGGSSAPVPAGISLGAQEELVVQDVAGLTPSTQYTVCLRAQDAAGEALSAPATFTTLPAPEPFGLHSLEVAAVNQNGSPDVQAGSHPYKLTTRFVLNELEEFETGHFRPSGDGLKDVRVELPPGFVGNPNATPKCSYHEFTERKCPIDTAVGEAATYLGEGEERTPLFITNPVYNIETPAGIPAEFGYLVKGLVPIFLDVSVRTGGDYGITVNVRNIPEILAIDGSKVTIWGVPAEPIHDPLRGKCLGEGEGRNEPKEEESVCPNPGVEGAVNIPVQPLLTNPTSCGVPRTATLSVDTWEEPGSFVSLPSALPELSGCDQLDFSPTIGVTPDGTAGSTPTGLNVELHVPQESTTNPVGLAEADVKDTTVALPPGVQLSPSAADGLQACSNAQIGFKGVNPATGADEFTPRLPGSILAAQAGETEPLRPGVNFCPDASKIANVRIVTPLLEHELTGSVYLAAPQNFTGLPENPFSSLIAMYLVAEEPNTGVLVKLPGRVSLNEETGQITTTFENTPQVPFSELKLEFYGTARAPLATPALCGTYSTESSFTPWSAAPAVHPPASFQITSGPNGSPCSDPLPFSPTLASGTTNINSGSFSELTTTLGREDGNQNIQSVTLHYPAGVSGLLSGVKLCGEAAANAGTCGPESQIGESTVSVGLGGDPFTVLGGKVYITGPYEGAPFGLSIVNPAKAGPFDLQEGRPVVVRAKIEVDPITAALTVTTNPSGPYAIPHMIEGIALNIKHVNVLINRPNFTFNPTNCNPTQVTGTINSDEGAGSPVAIPFQVTNCGDLKFAPKFAVSTSGKTSRANGASLAVRLTYPTGPNYANIARVKVDLPKQLPSRLTTLQKACVAKVFEANPAGCPAASIIGHAKAITPLIPVPLEGPAIFVSHGGEAFPSLTMVLQGDGVTIELVGTTFISKAGITNSTFKTVPDQPVGSFELTLPEGKYSALAANGNLCTSKLAMPTEFLAQNGAKINESTHVEVEGCPNTISISSHKVKGKTATLSVYVPAAGKLTASGKGLTSVAKTYSGQEAQSFTLTQKKPGKLKTKIKLSFTPSKGKKQSKSLTVRFTR